MEKYKKMFKEKDYSAIRKLMFQIEKNPKIRKQAELFVDAIQDEFGISEEDACLGLSEYFDVLSTEV